MMKSLLFFVAVLTGWCTAAGQEVKPFLYWNFDGREAAKDVITGKVLPTNKQCDYSLVEGIGKGADLQNKDCLISTNAFKNKVKNQFTIEFAFKGDALFFMTYAHQYLSIRFYYAAIQFRTSVTRNGKVVSEELVIKLDGSGKQSYSYLTDGEWHHLAFTASTVTGKKEVWVDGELLPGFSTTISKNVPFAFGANDGFRNTDQIDELAIYDKVLPAALIAQHASEVRSRNNYSFRVRQGARNTSTARTATTTKEVYDPLEFAPGYPDYTVQALDQLKAFPLPRYKTGVTMSRHVNWMDIMYLHRELPGRGGKGFGKVQPERAVQLSKEMADNWNYYIDLPVLRMPAAQAQKEYTNKNSVYGALVNFINKHPQYPWSAILMQVQGKPVHAGFDRNTAFVSAKDLPTRYYMRDASGKPVVYKGHKYLSPLMPLDIIVKDGATSRFYLDQLLKYVPKPPSIINENGEHFGHIRPLDLLKLDSRVLADYKKSGLSESGYSGRFQYRLDSTYRVTILKGLDSNNIHFSFYNVSAFHPEYWPAYAQRRMLNRWKRNSALPTPDFYPRYPDNWHTARGGNSGFGPVAAGRVTEMALGDKLFSPFVSAGWGPEQNNIRPAQWLALLKAMVMLGADFFYVGYFNVTGAGGKWPDGAGPNDPRGYAYQIAMPAYAQAIASHVKAFITDGELLNPAIPNPNDKLYQFRFAGKAQNELILVRKLGKKYLIYGSIQPNSNVKGNVPDSTITSFTLEGKQIRLKIRRQGSMYVLDESGAKPVFYQLDGWHENTHPWYWSKQGELEAELPDKDASKQAIGSELKVGNAIDLTSNLAWYVFNNTEQQPAYKFTTREPGEYYVYVRARLRKGNRATLTTTLAAEDSKRGNIHVTGSQWQWYQVKNLQLFCKEDTGIMFTVQLNTPEAIVEVDKYLITTAGNFAAQ